MQFISYKCVTGEVAMGSCCRLTVTFFLLVSPYQTRNNVVPQFILTPLSISLDLPLVSPLSYQLLPPPLLVGGSLVSTLIKRNRQSQKTKCPYCLLAYFP